MKILVTGSNGLLGQKLVYALRNRDDASLIATAIGKNRAKIRDGYIYETLDITDKFAVDAVMDKYRPDCVINTAAMTNVDACETDQEQCRKLNVDAVRYLIEACERNQSHLIQLSTD